MDALDRNYSIRLQKSRLKCRKIDRGQKSRPKSDPPTKFWTKISRKASQRWGPRPTIISAQVSNVNAKNICAASLGLGHGNKLKSPNSIRTVGNISRVFDSLHSTRWKSNSCESNESSLTFSQMFAMLSSYKPNPLGNLYRTGKTVFHIWSALYFNQDILRCFDDHFRDYIALGISVLNN